MSELSRASMERLLRRVWNGRVSSGALLEFRAVLESLGGKIAGEAVRRAEKEGVKTVNKRHIRSAIRELDK